MSIMKLLTEIRNSIYNPIYYRVVRSESTKKSLGYYYRFTLTLSVILTIIFAIIFVPLLTLFTQIVKGELANWYPAELELRLRSGELSTNVTEPYKIPLPEKWREEIMESDQVKLGDLENLLVIDTTHEFDLKQFEAYKTPAWLTKNSLVYYRENDRIAIEPLANIKTDLTINQTFIRDWITKLAPFLTVLAPVAVIAVLVGLIVAFSLYLLVLFIVALLVMLVGWLKQIKLSYWEAYRIAIHAATLPILLRFLLGALTPFIGLNFLPTILLLCVVAFNLKDEEGLISAA